MSAELLDKAILDLLPEGVKTPDELPPLPGEVVQKPETQKEQPRNDVLRSCRHCSAQFSRGLNRCPSCGKSQAGIVAGSTKKVPPEQPTPTVSALPVPVPVEHQKLSEAELLKLESAIGDTFALILEDIAAPMLHPNKVIPKLPEKISQKLGMVWAPIVGPLMSAQSIVWILAIAVTLKSTMSYMKECKAAPSIQ